MLPTSKLPPPSPPSRPPGSELAPGRGTRASQVASVLLAAAAVFVIAVSIVIEPDPRGCGTHCRLGLPPCASQVFLHAPCPFCGMTTSFCCMGHGRLAEAFASNPAGPLLYVLVWLAVPFFSYWAYTRRSLTALAWDWPLERPAAWLMVVILAGWAARLAMR